MRSIPNSSCSMTIALEPCEGGSQDCSDFRCYAMLHSTGPSLLVRALIFNFNTEYVMLRLDVSDTSTLTSIAFLSHLLRCRIFLEALNFPKLVVYLVKYLY